MHRLPTGTVTLLFGDVEASTRHLLRLGDRYGAQLDACRRLLREAIEGHGGHVVDIQADSCFAAFDRAADAVLAALDAQRALAGHPWPDGEPFRVRMGLHTGEPQAMGESYAGLDVHRAARIAAAAHGGQILLSQTTYDLVAGPLVEHLAARDLGEYRLKDLPRRERLFQVVADGLPSEFPAPRAVDTPTNLPSPAHDLIGREREVAACRAILRGEQATLLTLTGPGGSGKTTLALHLARELLDTFPDGVYFVPLAALSDPELVPRAIGGVLGIRETGARPLVELLVDALRERHALLLLDNFEQLLPAAPLLAELLDACPRLTLLVTSREILHLSAERDFPVLPLPVPAVEDDTAARLEDSPSVRLFVERARQARSGYALTDADAATVAEICRRLDGLPLAIELAAARVRLLPPHLLLGRLDRRLPLLTGGPRDLPARQQTLRDTIGWSHGLLSPEDQQLFRRLAVFVGGWDLASAETVVSGEWREVGGESLGAPLATHFSPLDTLEGLGSLVDKSLVRQHEGPDGEPRFGMLETIREFALEQLDAAGEMAALRRRHAEHFLTVAEEADPALIGPEQLRRLAGLEADYANLTAALDFAREAAAAGDPEMAELGLRLAGALHWFWWLGGHVGAGRGWLEWFLGPGGGESAGASGAARDGAAPDARRGAVRARALYAAGGLAMVQGEYDRAHGLFAESGSLYLDLGDERAAGRALGYRGLVETFVLDDETALQPFVQAEVLARRAGDDWGLALVISQLATLARRRGDYAEAAAQIEEASRLARRTGDRYLLGSCLPKWGNLLLAQGEFDRAAALYREALGVVSELHDGWWTARCLQFLALVAHGRGDEERAAALFGASDALLAAIGGRRIPREEADYATVTAEARDALGEEAYARAYEAGRSMPLAAAIHVALGDPVEQPA